jgi:hypothetical protein
MIEDLLLNVHRPAQSPQEAAYPPIQLGGVTCTSAGCNFYYQGD